MSDYKNTLNLPQTDFPMRGNLAQREPEMLARWYEKDIYGQLCAQGSQRDLFVLHDGPPYANGDIHMGHAVNKILKDIILKFKRLDGYHAPYVPGWDCHGLPIEHKVEKKIGKAGDKVDHRGFRKHCREYAMKQVDGQRRDFKRLGVLGDWDKPYLTMDPKVEANIIRALGGIYENGYLVRGYKPVYWSVVGRSALAEAEVEYQNKKSVQVDVGYLVQDEQNFLEVFSCSGELGEGEVSVVIWTTTPWTLPSSQAITVHAQITYVLVQYQSKGVAKRFIVAEELLVSVMARCHIDDFTILGVAPGTALEKKQVFHPFYNRLIPIILGEHVTLDVGTGCVHTAPDHGIDDFLVCVKYGISTLNYLDGAGYFREHVELFSGEHVYKVDSHVVEVLEGKGRLLSKGEIEHSYPHCWRTKTPLIFRATPQWFISMNENNLLEKVRASLAGVTFIPHWGRRRMEAMLENSPDWCVSRQRVWGVPIALFVHKDSGEPHPKTKELFEKAASLVEEHGIDAWYESDAYKLLPSKDADKYIRVTDTLDVWFDSGVTHSTVLDKHDILKVPADIYLEGSDQHRGWFQSSLKSSVAMRGESPYLGLLTHGFVVDANGRKMSKSLGNVISPQKLFKSWGADILRLWVASSDYTAEMTVSDEILKRISDSYRRIRNTARFLLANLHGFNVDTDLLPWEDMLSIDLWAVDCSRRLQEELKGSYENYNFSLVYQKINNFCSNDMGGFYLDIIKDRQYTTSENSKARRSCQTAMYHIVEAFVRWITPVLSFTADEIWQHIPGKRSESALLETYYDGLYSHHSNELRVEYWDIIKRVKTEVNKVLEGARRDTVIGGSLESCIVLFVEPLLLKELEKLGNELKFILIVSEVKLKSQEACSENVVKTEFPGLSVLVQKSSHGKCVRCWHHVPNIGMHEGFPDLCNRCHSNIAGKGEERLYA